MQGPLRSQTGSTHTVAVVSAETRPDDTEKKSVVKFDDDLNKGLPFYLLLL